MTLSSVTDITDPAGNTVESYDYDVYGAPTIRDASHVIRPSSLVGNSYLFTGRRWDQETGIYYYRARMFSPSLGRFLQRDPIGYYDSMNLYSYVGNNPVNWVDPWGLWTLQIGVQNTSGLGIGKSTVKGVIIGLSLKNGFQASTFTTRGKGIYSGAGFSGGLSLSVSSADNIKKLCGKSYSSGGSFGEIFVFGGEVNEIEDNLYLYTLNIGVGLGLFAESHLFKTRTKLGNNSFRQPK